MKKIIAAFIIVSLLLFNVAFSEGELTTVHDFEMRLGTATLLTGSKHYLNSSNDSRIDGSVNDVISVFFNESTFLMLSIPHGTDDVIGVLVCYTPDGSYDNAEEFLILCYEAIYAVGFGEDLGYAGEIIDELGMLSNLNDGDGNSITIDGIKFTYSVSSMIGISFYIEM